MTDAPTFIRRKVSSNPASVETGIRDILSKLKASADRDVLDVLAAATNTYINAIVRFTGQGMFKAKDIDNLIIIWQILLDVGQTDSAEFGGSTSGPKSGPKPASTEPPEAQDE